MKGSSAANTVLPWVNTNQIITQKGEINNDTHRKKI